MYDFDPWKFLGIENGSSIKQVEKRQRILTKHCLEKSLEVGGLGSDTEQLEKINKAADVLRNEKTRAIFMQVVSIDEDDFPQPQIDFKSAWKLACDTLVDEANANTFVEEEMDKNAELITQENTKRAREKSRTEDAIHKQKLERAAKRQNEAANQAENAKNKKKQVEATTQEISEKTTENHDNEQQPPKQKARKAQERKKYKRAPVSLVTGLTESPSIPKLVLNETFLANQATQITDKELSNAKNLKSPQNPAEVLIEEEQSVEKEVHPKDIIIEELKNQLAIEKEKNSKLSAQLTEIEGMLANALKNSGTSKKTKNAKYRSGNELRKMPMIQKFESLNLGNRTEKGTVHSGWEENHVPMGMTKCKCNKIFKDNTALKKHCRPTWIKCKKCPHACRIDNFLEHLRNQHPKKFNKIQKMF